MRQLYLFITFLLLCPGLPAVSGIPGVASNPAVAAPDFCRMFGTIYLEYIPARKAGTHYTIFVEEEEAFADVKIFKEDNKLFADAPGLWYIAPARNFADHIFFVTTNRNQADFTVHFTDVRSFAGCKK